MESEIRKKISDELFRQYSSTTSGTQARTEAVNKSELWLKEMKKMGNVSEAELQQEINRYNSHYRQERGETVESRVDEELKRLTRESLGKTPETREDWKNYLLIFNVRASNVRDHSVEEIVYCQNTELSTWVRWKKEEIERRINEQQGKYQSSAPDDYRETWVTVVLSQVLPLSD